VKFCQKISNTKNKLIEEQKMKIDEQKMQIDEQKKQIGVQKKLTDELKQRCSSHSNFQRLSAIKNKQIQDQKTEI